MAKLDFGGVSFVSDQPATSTARSARQRRDAALLVEALERSFGPREVLRDLHVTLERGERLALCGPNGSGKTTLLRCVAGTVTPTAGRITVFGHAAGSREARRVVGVSLSQERSFYLRLSGRENLLFAAGVRGIPRSDAARRVAALEEELELSAILAERVDRCSTGMVQQLALARALIGDPAVALLDEPTRSLDAQAYDRLWDALDARPHLVLVVATHRDDDTRKCHRRLDLDVLEPDRD
jgi:ABC-type multidrug transport system ATPase subunit